MLPRLLVLFLTLGLVVWYGERTLMIQSPGNEPVSSVRSGVEPPRIPGPERIAAARNAREALIATRCKDAGLPYPPRELFLRAFKAEAELEAWGREDEGEFKRIALFPVTSSSGNPGPKRREGDLQVPEGCYRLTVFNPESSFHLSLGLDYPNAADRILSDPIKPGFDIYIHGGAASVGCLSIGDEPVEELFLLAFDTKKRGATEIPVHIFPARMEGPKWEMLRAAHPKHEALWQQLGAVYKAFEATRRIPKVTVAADGSYQVQ